MKNVKNLICCFVTALVFALLIPVYVAPTGAAINETEQALLDGINVQNAMAVATWISGGKQKIAGTAAENAAADMLVDKFNEIGLQNVRKEPFNVNVHEPITSDDVGYALSAYPKTLFRVSNHNCKWRFLG